MLWPATKINKFIFEWRGFWWSPSSSMPSSNQSMGMRVSLMELNASNISIFFTLMLIWILAWWNNNIEQKNLKSFEFTYLGAEGGPGDLLDVEPKSVALRIRIQSLHCILVLLLSVEKVRPGENWKCVQIRNHWNIFVHFLVNLMQIICRLFAKLECHTGAQENQKSQWQDKLYFASFLPIGVSYWQTRTSKTPSPTSYSDPAKQLFLGG